MSRGGATAMEHHALEDFEQFDFSPCGCGCGGWVVWNGGDDSWDSAGDYEFYVVDPEAKTKGDEIVALVVRRETSGV